MRTRTVFCKRCADFVASHRELLSKFGFDVVDGAGTVRDIQVRCQENPDLILFDLDQAFRQDRVAIGALRDTFPRVRLVGIHRPDVVEDQLVAGLSAGLDGFLCTDVGARELLSSLVAIIAGAVVFSRPMAALLRGEEVDGDFPFPEGVIAANAEVDTLTHASFGIEPHLSNGEGIRLTVPAEGRPATLSTREQDIVSHLVRGRTNKQIADSLNLKESTVKSHLKTIMRKIDVSNRNQIIMWAIRFGVTVVGDEVASWESSDDNTRIMLPRATPALPEW